MRLRAISLGVLAAVSGVVLACGGDDSGDSGGAGSGADSCPVVKACGGDPAGDWTVDGVCVSDPDKLFAATVNQPACSSALKSVKNVDGSGTYKLGTDKNAMSGISVSGTGEFSFNDACVKALGIADSAASECSKVKDEFSKQSSVENATCAANGANCDCTIQSTIPLTGMGSYTVSGTNLTVSGLTQPFCVDGTNKLTIQSTRSGTTLTFTLTK